MTDEKAAEKPELPLAANYGVQETFRLLRGAEEISKETAIGFSKGFVLGGAENLFMTMAAACPGPAAHQRDHGRARSPWRSFGCSGS